jgi:hypothetical protein
LELLGRRSPAPAEDVAGRILGEDVTQIGYYTERVKRMVDKVLTSNGITAYANGAYNLIGADDLNNAERDELQQLWRHRTAINGSIKYRVLTRVGFPTPQWHLQRPCKS